MKARMALQPAAHLLVFVRHWRRLNGPELVAKVITGVKFVDGEELTKQGCLTVTIN
jgi:hypothetical protein